MIISARRERQLSIAATVLLTAAIFVMPVKTRTFDGSSVNLVEYIKTADATPLKLSIRN